MATLYPKPYDRRKWDNFIVSYEEQLERYVTQGCDFYFNLLFWRAIRCVPLAIFLRHTMPEFCRGYMGYLFRYFLNGEHTGANYYKDNSGKKISKLTSEFDGEIKERELAKKIMHEAGGKNGEDAFRYRGQLYKDVDFGTDVFGCEALYNAVTSSKHPKEGGNIDAYKGHQYYMQACLEILNNGCCRSGPHSALRKLGIDTRGKAPGWGEGETLERRMWMLYSPNNSGVYSIHYWPETVHMFIRGIRIMNPGTPVWASLADPWNIPGTYPRQDDAIAPWLVGRSIHCFLNDVDAFQAVSDGLTNPELLERCLRSTAIRDLELASVETTWIMFEYYEDSAMWLKDFVKDSGRNNIIQNAVNRAREAARYVVGKYLTDGYDGLEEDDTILSPPSNLQFTAFDVHELADTKHILNDVKQIDKESGRGMTGHIAKYKQTALDNNDLYKKHLDVSDMPFKMAEMEEGDIGNPIHRLETIRALVAGDDGAPPIPDNSKKETYINLQYSPRSARMGIAIEAAHTTITVKRVVHLCMIDHLTAEGIIYPGDDGGITIPNPDKLDEDGNQQPWTWEDFRYGDFESAIWPESYNNNNKIQRYIAHNAITAWNDTFFLFAALGDGHFWVDDADGALEMAIQPGGQRYIWNYGIRKLEQVECLPQLEEPDQDTFVQFWSNMVFFALFGGLNPYKEYWLPNPINETIRVYSAYHFDPDWLFNLNIRHSGDDKATVINNLGVYIAEYIDKMMNIQAAKEGEKMDIEESLIKGEAGPVERLKEDLVDEYFPQRQLVFDHVVNMIVPYVVNADGQMIRKQTDEDLYKVSNREIFHSYKPQDNFHEVILEGVEDTIDLDKDPKSGGWFIDYWTQVFNGQVSRNNQFKSKNQGGVLGKNRDEIDDVIFGVAPLPPSTWSNKKNTTMPYATLNTIMWPNYTSKTSGKSKDIAEQLKFYKIQLRNVLTGDTGIGLDNLIAKITNIDHVDGGFHLPNIYEMGLFYAEWHVQSYMFRQIYLDGRDDQIGKNCWDGFRAQDKELSRVVGRPCFLKFNDHARQYNRDTNSELFNPALEPFLMSDSQGQWPFTKRTPFPHRGIESNMIGHCINSKKSATSVQRRMTIGFAEQIQRISDVFPGHDRDLTIEREGIKDPEGDSVVYITSIRTPIEWRSVSINTNAKHADWWSANQLNPMKAKCQPGVIILRTETDWQRFNDGSDHRQTGLIFDSQTYRHSEMMIGGRCYALEDGKPDGDIDRATWNELPEHVRQEPANGPLPNVPYYSVSDPTKKPSPLVRIVLNYKAATTAGGAVVMEEEDDYLYHLKKLKF